MTDSKFLNHYQLISADIDVKIRDEHVDKIARICFSNWKELYPLHMKKKDLEVIDTKSNSEDKSKLFIRTWKQRNGSDATYKRLIDALLEIDHREDAESVFDILMSKKEYESSAALENGSMSAGIS